MLGIAVALGNSPELYGQQLVIKDTTYLDHRTCRNQTGIDLEASLFLLC